MAWQLVEELLRLPLGTQNNIIFVLLGLNIYTFQDSHSWFAFLYPLYHFFYNKYTIIIGHYFFEILHLIQSSSRSISVKTYSFDD